MAWIHNSNQADQFDIYHDGLHHSIYISMRQTRLACDIPDGFADYMILRLLMWLLPYA
jgi:hypothetical protein